MSRSLERRVRSSARSDMQRQGLNPHGVKKPGVGNDCSSDFDHVLRAREEERAKPAPAAGSDAGGIGLLGTINSPVAPTCSSQSWLSFHVWEDCAGLGLTERGLRFSASHPLGLRSNAASFWATAALPP